MSTASAGVTLELSLPNVVSGVIWALVESAPETTNPAVAREAAASNCQALHLQKLKLLIGATLLNFSFPRDFCFLSIICKASFIVATLSK